MNTVYNVSYKDRIKKQEIQEEVLVDFTTKYHEWAVVRIEDYWLKGATKTPITESLI